ncbi:PIG-L family deacetylase [Oleispirillum naphthae]|uniref:PIG-L deacetylase family protein n=1 Tax=Oleispirillum naphthae TaxID=2838853 RepID=UPI0030825FC8
MSIVLAIAPHPDDETLGCGGALLRHRARGDDIHWLIVTALTPRFGDAARIAGREREIAAVAEAFGFASTVELGFETTALDRVPMGDLVARIAGAVDRLRAETVYLPHPGDAHSDHRAVFQAGIGATKCFRHPSVKRVLAYETLSETNFGLDPLTLAFRPTTYAPIGPWLDRKVEIMGLYEGETGTHPFPRSERAIRAQATLRGTECGTEAAEAFMLIKEILP